jgi:LCP family protein required for cell wall assembly
MRLWIAIAAISPLAQPSDLLALVTNGSAARPGSATWKLDHGQPVNILLLGYGGDGHAGPYQTDSILLLSVRDMGKRATLLSIPRDLFVRIPALPGGAFLTARINNAYAIGVDRTMFPDVREQWKAVTGGGDLAAATVTEVTGQSVDGWVAVDFRAFKDLVDAVGGVEVTVPHPLDDPLFPAGETTGYTHIHFDAGPQRLNGEQALEYARSRQTTSDLDRSARQRMLLVAIRRRLDSLLAVPRLVSALLVIQDDVRTNLRPPEMRRLLEVFSRVPENAITQTAVDPALLDQVTTPDGFYVLVPKDLTYGQLRASVATAIGSPVS